MSSEARIFETGKNRIETLSDGIFGIVMTLLINAVKENTQTFFQYLKTLSVELRSHSPNRILDAVIVQLLP